MLRDPVLRQQLIDALVCTPYARTEFEQAWIPTADQVELARRLCIRAQMGFGSAGATKGATGFRIDTKREYGTAQHLWATYPASIAAVGQRMSGVLIENSPALDVMQQHDSPGTLHFVDPPYMHETRVMIGSRRTYNHELTDLDHGALLDGLLELKGFVVLSGYDSPLYRDRLDGWICHTTRARISAGRGTAIREEMVWLNPRCAAALNEEDVQGRMFA